MIGETTRRGTLALSRALLLPCALLAGGCGSDDGAAEPPLAPLDVRLELAERDTLVFDAGGSSPSPIRVRLWIDGVPGAGERVGFSVPSGLGRASQPSAPVDAEGWAESWILDARPGSGRVTAEFAGMEVGRPVRISRAPGELRLEAGAGRLGRPGFPHPDSILRARLLDTEGLPLAGREIRFIWSGALRTAADTTDMQGRAYGLLGESPLAAGEWPVFALLAERNLSAVDRRTTTPAAERVVVVSIDGLRAEALDNWAPPVLTALATGGAFAERARSIEPTFSMPAHLSLLSGVGPERHRIFSENLEFTPEMNRLDPVFRVGLRRGRSTAAVIDDAGHLARFDEILECRLAFGFDDLETVSGRAAGVIDAALARLEAESAPELLFLHIPDPDLAGHEYGWGSPEYGAAVLAADAEIGRLLPALSEETLLVILSTHGGGGDLGTFQHGSTSPADIEVPVILHGAGVLSGVRLANVDLLDVAPTLGWALGWAPPDQYAGQILLEAFGEAPEAGTTRPESGPTRP